MTSHPPQPAPGRPASGQSSLPPLAAAPFDDAPFDAPPSYEALSYAASPYEAPPFAAPRYEAPPFAVPPDHAAAWPTSGAGWPDPATSGWPDGRAAGWPDSAGHSQPDSAAGTGWPDDAETAWAHLSGQAIAPAQPAQGQLPPSQASVAPDSDGWQDRAAADEPGFTAGQLTDHELTDDERWAALSYLAVPFLGFLIPLAIYLVKKRRSSMVRRHAAQALNVSITGLLYTFCVLILGTILALDTLNVALLIAVPLAVALWVATLVYVVRAAGAASRGAYFQIPAWICATIAR
jgi:uncharacterized Tic20 family protein